MKEALRQNLTEQFGKIIETLQSGYVLTEREGNIADVNPAYCDMVGYSKEELLSMNLNDLRIDPAENFQSTFFQEVLENESSGFEVQHITKSGKKIDFLGSATAIEIDGKTYVAEFLRNITKRKEEQRKHEAIFNSAFQFIGLMSPDGTLLEANQTALKFGGLEEEDVIGKPVWQTYWWQTNEETKLELKKAVQQAARGEFVRYEADVRGKDDAVETIDFSIKPVFDDEGKVEMLIPEGRVITEKKKIENKLKKSEQQLSSLFAHNPLPVYLFDLEGNFIRLNDKLIEFTGRSLEELLELNFADFVHEDDLEKVNNHFEQAVSGESGQYEIRVIVRDDEQREVRVTKFPMYENGEATGVYGILEDITETKEAERKVEETIYRFRSLFNNNPQPVYYFDLKGNFLRANKRTEEVSGYSQDELLAMNFAPIIVEEDLERTQQHFESAASGSVEVYEIQIKTKQEEIKDLRVTNFPMREGDEIVGVFGIAEDITEAIRAKEQLEESEQRFKSLFEHNPNAVYSFDLEGNFLMANGELEVLLGYSMKELKEMNFEPLTQKEDRKKVWGYFNRAAQGESQRYEASGIHREGHKVHFYITNLPIYVNDKIVGVFGIAQDITEQKKLQNQLKKSKQRWQHLVEGNPQPVQVTIDGEIVFINQAGAELYGADTPEEVTGISVFTFSHPGYEDKIEERKYKLENDLSVDTTHEHKIKRLDGESRYVIVHSIPIEYQDEKAIQTVLNDITGRIKQERIIKESLKEKEVLLKEIHHRVKNNMAVVSGLLQLQAMNTEDEALRELLQESQLRIYSMAMIHEKLYQTETLSDIGVETYIKELVETIKDTVGKEDMNVDIKYELEELNLDVNQAIPCALIINELIVNCFKHAFPDTDKGIIHVGLYKENSRVQVTVKDNGAGLPDDFNIDNMQTLGMTLMQTLAGQLEGKVGFTKGTVKSGAEFYVEFPLKEA